MWKWNVMVWMVKKIFFDEGVDKKKRKQVKSKFLTENKGILLLDMTPKFNLKSGTTDTIACDILTITNGPIEFNALKEEIQDYSNEGYLVIQPYGIPGGERVILKVDSKKQEVKFLTVSFYNRESKVMLQGNHKPINKNVSPIPQMCILNTTILVKKIPVHFTSFPGKLTLCAKMCKNWQKLSVARF